MAGTGSKGQHRGNSYRGGKKSRVHFPGSSSLCIWQPAVPEWERKFCQEVGLFEWEKFKQAKTYIHLFDKVMQWDDSAAQEAFHNAKNHFKAKLEGLPTNDDALLAHADMYVDHEIDWTDSEEDLQLYLDIDKIHESRIKKTYLEEEEEKPAWINIRLEEIKPTGWDVDIAEVNRQLNNPVLTGMIVGE